MSTVPTTTTTVIELITDSHKNLSSAISRRRPWPEFLTSLSSPHSISIASSRFRHNSNYFSVNYSIIMVLSTAASLISTPFSLILISAVFYSWLVFHFFRQNSLVVFGRVVTDFVVILVLLVLTFLVLCVTGPLTGLSYGVGIGLFGCVVHAVLRDDDGLFFDENEALSNGLIAPRGVSV